MKKLSDGKPFDIKSIESNIETALAEMKIDDARLPEVRLDINGFDAKIGQMTAEAIRASGMKVAADLLEVAAQARMTADAIQAEAMQVAKQISEATGNLADRLSSYVESCKTAADSFRTHRERLANLPALIEGVKIEGIKEEAAQ